MSLTFRTINASIYSVHIQPVDHHVSINVIHSSKFTWYYIIVVCLQITLNIIYNTCCSNTFTFHMLIIYIVSFIYSYCCCQYLSLCDLQHIITIISIGHLCKFYAVYKFKYQNQMSSQRALFYILYYMTHHFYHYHSVSNLTTQNEMQKY